MKTKTTCKVCGAVIEGKTLSDGKHNLFEHLMGHPEATMAIQAAISERRRLQGQRQDISQQILTDYGYQLAGF